LSIVFTASIFRHASNACHNHILAQENNNHHQEYKKNGMLLVAWSFGSPGAIAGVSTVNLTHRAKARGSRGHLSTVQQVINVDCKLACCY